MKITLPVWKVTLLISLFIAVFGNFSFWKSMLAAASFKEEPFLFVAFFVVITMLINLLLTLFSFRPVFKLVASVLILTSAFAAYFMDNYAVMIDKGMVQNVLLTDYREASELFSLRLLITVFLLGIVPVALLYKVRIQYQPFWKGLWHKGLVLVVTTGILAGTLYSNYKEISFFGREHRELRHLINPTNYIFSLESIISRHWAAGKIMTQPIGTDARKALPEALREKPALVIFVLGETVRSMNFSLNGYERETNPLLAKEDLINFTDVSSCGTATAVSVPCMFSRFGRKEYSDIRGKQYENVLDVIQYAGYEVIWRDNNSGCQGTCKRVEFDNLAHKDTPEYCKADNCVDAILLDGLQQWVDRENTGTEDNRDTKPKAENGSSAGHDKRRRDKFIVLHQKGNHGPTYYRRYPNTFEVFKPACKTNQLQSCSREEVVNAYDNALLYTDYNLSRTIDFLKRNSTQYDTALVYMSDHGESLGENNLYLHGLPYMLAPDYQKKVPFFLWLSEGYQQTYGIDKQCLASKTNHALSHDNLFSSLLGLLAIQTEVRDEQLDIFSSCHTRPTQN